MITGLKITAAWETLDAGSSEEKASFGMLVIVANDVVLSEGQDAFVDRLRNGPYVSNYHLAEWLVWNWWRLRWEPYGKSDEWALSHNMASVGQGYVWPNISISSDGERVALVARPSSGQCVPFRYICTSSCVVRAAEFESAVDGFILQVLAQLRAKGIGETNLDTLWRELGAERRDAALAERRRFEALLGCHPGEANAGSIAGLVEDALELGEGPMQEIAAMARIDGKVLRAQDFRESAKTAGFVSRRADAVQISTSADLPAVGFKPAWQLGAAAAKALRTQLDLGQNPITNRRLAEMAAVDESAVSDSSRRNAELSFALDDRRDGHIVLRAKKEPARRFDLACIIGDRATISQHGTLRPATDAPTYRQRMQRAFAAEFLCPLEGLVEKLEGDFSTDAIDDAAAYFGVSDRAARTHLVNNRIIDRDQLDSEVPGIAT